MKKNTIITVLALGIAGVASVMTGCSIDSKREPGKVYMPDMAYSRAIETYAALDSTVFTTDSDKIGEEIYYSRMPVEGTIRKGDLMPYPYANDSAGYAMSAQVKNPMPALNSVDSAEASRLFNINCAICHGADGKADGPLSSKIGGIANFTQPKYIEMADGTMFHSINFGKNLMGSYASQLSRQQRWMIIHYIRTLQPKPAADSTSTVKK